MSPDSFKNVFYRMCFEIIYLIYMHMDLALNNLQWLICHKTKPNYWTQVIFKQNYLTPRVDIQREELSVIIMTGASHSKDRQNRILTNRYSLCHIQDTINSQAWVVVFFHFFFVSFLYLRVVSVETPASIFSILSPFLFLSHTVFIRLQYSDFFV